MNKLEEQLRASRHTEVPGLTPPPGGWEAISGQLANGAAGASAATGSGSGTGATAGNGVAAGGAAASGSTAAATGIKALALKWIAGLGATLLVGGGITYAVIAGGNPATTTAAVSSAVTPMTAEISPRTEASPTEPVTAGPEIIDATPEKVAKATRRLMSSPTGKAPTASLSTIQQSGSTPLPTAAQQAEPSPRRADAPAKPATGSRSVTLAAAPPAANGTDYNDNDVKKSSPTGEPTTENIPANALPALPAETPTQATSVKKTVAAPGPERMTDKAPATTAANGAPVIPTGNAKANALPTQAGNLVAALLPPRAVTPLPLTPTLLSSSFTSPVATPPKFDLPEFGRNGKRRAPAYWEYHGSLSAYYYQNYKRSAYYERQPGTGPFTFVLPTGETIRATTALSLSDETPSLEQGFYLKGGIDRQTSSGFLFRLSAGLSFFDERKNDDNFNLVSDNLIREDQKAVEWSLPVEVGVQYTFLKRHRLRPYLGVSMIGTLFHHSVLEATFFDGRTMLSGTSERTVNRFFFGGLRDIGLEAGVQYRLNNLWSVGILTRVSSDFHVYIPAALGAEVRYSLK